MNCQLSAVAPSPTEWLFSSFPGSSDGKCRWQCRRPGSIPGLGRPSGGEYYNPLQYSCLENPHGQRGLPGDGPRGRQELDMTEWLTLLLWLHCPHPYPTYVSSLALSRPVLHFATSPQSSGRPDCSSITAARLLIFLLLRTLFHHLPNSYMYLMKFQLFNEIFPHYPTENSTTFTHTH